MPDADLSGCRVLLVDDERTILLALRDSLRDAGAEVLTAASAGQALELLASHPIDVLISDVRMPGLSGIDLLREAHQTTSDLPVILMTAFANVDTAVEAMKAGAYDYVTKPFPNEKVVRIAANAWSLLRLRSEVEELRSRSGVDYLVGTSATWRRVIDKVETVAPTESTVLIVGKSGTGKELVARALHQRSRRRGPFVRVHCAALPLTLMETELFGHVKGAFTGATADAKGRFELAQGGTLLLDEVDEIPPEVQVKLLRVIQERVIERVGSGQSVAVDVRLIATCKSRLEDMVEAGRFREDLFYRLSVVQVELPALRDRRDDIPLLIGHFLRQCAQRLDRPVRFTPEALEALRAYDYPGNVRELEHVVESACAQSSGAELGVELLPAQVRTRVRSRVGFSARALSEVMEEAERSYLEHALREFDGPRSELADLLGISRKSLWQKLKKHRLSGA